MTIRGDQIALHWSIQCQPVAQIYIALFADDLASHFKGHLQTIRDQKVIFLHEGQATVAGLCDGGCFDSIMTAAVVIVVVTWRLVIVARIVVVVRLVFAHHVFRAVVNAVGLTGVFLTRTV